MQQNIRVTAFTVSELLKENQQEWGEFPSRLESIKIKITTTVIYS